MADDPVLVPSQVMTESDEEFCELPDISIESVGLNSSNVSKSDSFVMPAADELASQRERELQCEQELRALQTARCDSSGSEGEAALAAAVMALRVQPAPAPTPAPATQALSVSALLNALLPYLPTTDFLLDYLHLCRQTDPHTLTIITDDMVSSVCGMLACESNMWNDEEAVALGAWLCAVCVAGASRGAGGAAGAAAALRVLAGERMSAAQAAALRGVLVRAPPAALLPLADALAGAAGGALAAALRDAALARALGLQEEHLSNANGDLVDVISSEWGSLDAGARYTVVQAVGRRLAAGAGGDAERLLRVLARTIPASHRHHPDYLKVLAGASKLQLLFGSKK